MGPNAQGKRRRCTAGALGTNTDREDGEAMSSSLSDFGIVGCERAAAAHFLPSSCP